MSETDFAIEKSIPIPEPRKGGRPKLYRWDDMEIGDSVLVGSYDTAKIGQEWARRHLRKFTYQKQLDGSGWRVWRTA